MRTKKKNNKSDGALLGKYFASAMLEEAEFNAKNIEVDQNNQLSLKPNTLVATDPISNKRKCEKLLFGDDSEGHEIIIKDTSHNVNILSLVNKSPNPLDPDYINALAEVAEKPFNLKSFDEAYKYLETVTNNSPPPKNIKNELIALASSIGAPFSDNKRLEKTAFLLSEVYVKFSTFLESNRKEMSSIANLLKIQAMVEQYAKDGKPENIFEEINKLYSAYQFYLKAKSINSKDQIEWVKLGDQKEGFRGSLLEYIDHRKEQLLTNVEQRVNLEKLHGSIRNLNPVAVNAYPLPAAPTKNNELDAEIKAALLKGDLDKFKKLCERAKTENYDLNSYHNTNENKLAVEAKAYLQLAMFEGQTAIFKYMVETLKLDLAANLSQLTYEFNNQPPKLQLSDVKEILDFCFEQLKGDKKALSDSRLLMYAVYYGHETLVNDILNMGVEINFYATSRNNGLLDTASIITTPEYTRIFKKLLEQPNLNEYAAITNIGGSSYNSNQPFDYTIAREQTFSAISKFPDFFASLATEEHVSKENFKTRAFLITKRLLAPAATTDDNRELATAIALYALVSALGDDKGCEGIKLMLATKPYINLFPNDPENASYNSKLIRDFKANPEEILKKLFKFAEIVSDPARLEAFATLYKKGKVKSADIVEFDDLIKKYGTFYPLNIIKDKVNEIVLSPIPTIRPSQFNTPYLMIVADADELTKFARQLVDTPNDKTSLQFEERFANEKVLPFTAIDNRRKEIIIEKEILNLKVYSAGEHEKISNLVAKIKVRDEADSIQDAIKKQIPSLMTNAIKSGDVNEVAKLCTVAKNLGIKLNEFTKTTGDDKLTPNDHYLTHALMSGKFEVFKELEKQGITLPGCLNDNSIFREGTDKTGRDGALKILKYLCTKDEMISFEPGKPNMLLEFALHFNDEETLLATKYTFGSIPGQKSALQIAILMGDEKVVNEILQKADSLKKSISITSGILEDALKSPNIAVAKFIVEKAGGPSNPNVQAALTTAADKVKKQFEPSKELKDAVVAGDIGKVMKICERAKAAGIDLNKFTKTTNSFRDDAPDDHYLTHALLNGKKEIFDYLTTTAGISPPGCLSQVVKDADFQNKPNFAATTTRSGALEILKSLSEVLTTPQQIDDSKLLEFAAFFGDVDTVKYCLDKGGNPNITCSGGKTAISSAYEGSYGTKDDEIYILLHNNPKTAYDQNRLDLCFQRLANPALATDIEIEHTVSFITDLILKYPDQVTAASRLEMMDQFIGSASLNPTLKNQYLKALLISATCLQNSQVTHVTLDEMIKQILKDLKYANFHLPQFQSEEGIKSLLGANAELIRTTADPAERETLVKNIIEYIDIISDPIKLKEFANKLAMDPYSPEAIKFRGLYYGDKAKKFFPLEIINKEKELATARVLLEYEVTNDLLSKGTINDSNITDLQEYVTNITDSLVLSKEYNTAIRDSNISFNGLSALTTLEFNNSFSTTVNAMSVTNTKNAGIAKSLYKTIQQDQVSGANRFKSNQEQNEARIANFLRGQHIVVTDREQELNVKLLNPNTSYPDLYKVLGELKDLKEGITWQEHENLDGSKHLIRDARESKVLPNTNSIYGRAMTVLNTCRAAEDLINKSGHKDKDKLLAEIREWRSDVLEKAYEGIEFDYVLDYNAKIVSLLEKNKIGGKSKETVAKTLRYSNEFLHLKEDTQYHITTISSATKDGGQTPVNVIETDTMLLGLTDEQRGMYTLLLSVKNETLKAKEKSVLNDPKLYPECAWFFKMKKFEQNLTLECIPAILEGKGVIPTQLRKQLPGIRNAHMRSVSVYEGGVCTKVLEAFRTGTLSYLGKDEENAGKITEENIRQFMHLTGRTPVINDLLSSADWWSSWGKQGPIVIDRINKAAAELEHKGVKRATTPFNLFRIISRKNYTGYYTALFALGESLEKSAELKDKTKFISEYLKTNDPLSGIRAEAARKQLEVLKTDNNGQYYQLALELENAINAHENMNKHFVRRENLSAQIAADMTNVFFALTNENGLLRNQLGASKADTLSLLIMCMSGKDRTQTVLAEAERRRLEMHGIDSPEQLVIRHPTKMAEANGGTPGCYGIQENSASQAPAGLQGVVNQLGQKTAKNNKMTYEHGLIKRAIKALTSSKNSPKAAVPQPVLSQGIQAVNDQLMVIYSLLALPTIQGTITEGKLANGINSQELIKDFLKVSSLHDTNSLIKEIKKVQNYAAAPADKTSTNRNIAYRQIREACDLLQIIHEVAKTAPKSPDIRKEAFNLSEDIDLIHSRLLQSPKFVTHAAAIVGKSNFEIYQYLQHPDNMGVINELITEGLLEKSELKSEVFKAISQQQVVKNAKIYEDEDKEELFKKFHNDMSKLSEELLKLLSNPNIDPDVIAKIREQLLRELNFEFDGSQTSVEASVLKNIKIVRSVLAEHKRPETEDFSKAVSILLKVAVECDQSAIADKLPGIESVLSDQLREAIAPITVADINRDSFVDSSKFLRFLKENPTHEIKASRFLTLAKKLADPATVDSDSAMLEALNDKLFVLREALEKFIRAKEVKGVDNISDMDFLFTARSIEDAKQKAYLIESLIASYIPKSQSNERDYLTLVTQLELLKLLPDELEQDINAVLTKLPNINAPLKDDNDFLKLSGMNRQQQLEYLKGNTKLLEQILQHDPNTTLKSDYFKQATPKDLIQKTMLRHKAQLNYDPDFNLKSILGTLEKLKFEDGADKKLIAIIAAGIFAKTIRKSKWGDDLKDDLVKGIFEAAVLIADSQKHALSGRTDQELIEIAKNIGSHLRNNNLEQSSNIIRFKSDDPSKDQSWLIKNTIERSVDDNKLIPPKDLKQKTKKELKDEKKAQQEAEKNRLEAIEREKNSPEAKRKANIKTFEDKVIVINAIEDSYAILKDAKDVSTAELEEMKLLYQRYNTVFEDYFITVEKNTPDGVSLKAEHNALISNVKANFSNNNQIIQNTDLTELKKDQSKSKAEADKLLEFKLNKERGDNIRVVIAYYFAASCTDTENIISKFISAIDLDLRYEQSSQAISILNERKKFLEEFSTTYGKTKIINLPNDQATKLYDECTKQSLRMKAVSELTRDKEGQRLLEESFKEISGYPPIIQTDERKVEFERAAKKLYGDEDGSKLIEEAKEIPGLSNGNERMVELIGISVNDIGKAENISINKPGQYDLNAKIATKFPTATPTDIRKATFYAAIYARSTAINGASELKAWQRRTNQIFKELVEAVQTAKGVNPVINSPVTSSTSSSPPSIPSASAKPVDVLPAGVEEDLKLMSDKYEYVLKLLFPSDKAYEEYSAMSSKDKLEYLSNNPTILKDVLTVIPLKDMKSEYLKKLREERRSKDAKPRAEEKKKDLEELEVEVMKDYVLNDKQESILKEHIKDKDAAIAILKAEPTPENISEKIRAACELKNASKNIPQLANVIKSLIDPIIENGTFLDLELKGTPKDNKAFLQKIGALEKNGTKLTIPLDALHKILADYQTNHRGHTNPPTLEDLISKPTEQPNIKNTIFGQLQAEVATAKGLAK